jgi:hypothetical protein
MRKSLLLPGVCLVLLCGCEKKPQLSYAPLDAMTSTSIDELKKQKVTEMEIVQLSKLKAAGAADDFCLTLFNIARQHHHDFSSGDSAVDLSRAGYSDAQILEMAKSNQIDLLSGEAITLKLIGISNPTIQEIIHRRIEGLPTLTSEQIGRLKNTALTEKQILEIIDKGMSNEDAEKLIAQREAARNHSHTEFVRNSGRRRH